MKNTLLILVLGLFAVGCLEDGPMTPAGFEFYECPTTGTVYGDEDTCEGVCDEECIEA
tara:strand:+ start:409 stop:582 length:174 start_codon:yes stop_codon:yes gene_type:complete